MLLIIIKLRKGNSDKHGVTYTKSIQHLNLKLERQTLLRCNPSIMIKTKHMLCACSQKKRKAHVKCFQWTLSTNDMIILKVRNSLNIEKLKIRDDLFNCLFFKSFKVSGLWSTLELLMIICPHL